MKKYITIIFLGALIWACSDSDKSSNSNSSKKEPVAAKAPDGKKIFKRNCVICHGIYGDMAINGAKDLNLSILTLEERIEIITNGKKVMTPFKSVLSEEEIEAVANYTLDAFNKKE